MSSLTIAFLGNFQPRTSRGEEFSTESHLALSFESLGHSVVRIQEGQTRALDVPAIVAESGADALWWVQTYGLAVSGGTIAERFNMLDRIREQGIPSVGVHLDRWFGLNREDQIATEPFFRVDLLATADGGHDDQWQAAGINHVWSPPAVYHAEAVDGAWNRHFASDVAFVGSWNGYGHPEWEPMRTELISRMRGWYGERFRTWPEPGHQAIRGAMLNDLYASVKVIVGDSCLAPAKDGQRITRYVSDRCFETPGRGGFLVHPRVQGLDAYLRADEHFAGYDLGDWDELHEVIEYYLAHDAERETLRRAGATHVRSSQTYRDRLTTLIEVLYERRLLRREVLAWD